MAGMETYHVTTALNWLSGEQGMGCGRCGRARRRQDRGIVIFEDCCVLVLLVLLPAGAGVPWAQVALRIIRGKVDLLWRLCLSQPRPLRAMRRNEDVLAGKRVDCNIR